MILGQRFGRTICKVMIVIESTICKVMILFENDM